jgi:TFIIF-interacting CTD phosphatase-like protein
MLALLLVGTVFAVDKGIGINPKPEPLPAKNIGLKDDKIQRLADKGISNVNLIEYPCDDGFRCFAVSGDLNENLISINTSIRDGCIMSETVMSIMKVVQVVNKKKIENKTVPFNITKRECTGEYNYRELTEDEIQTMANNALNKRLEEHIQDQNPYYPIAEDVKVKTKPISIGKSIGDWVQQTLSQLKQLVGFGGF